MDPSEASERSSATLMVLITGRTNPYCLYIIINQLILERQLSVSVEQTEQRWLQHVLQVLSLDRARVTD